MVLQVGGNDGAPPFALKGKINNVTFTTMIDSGSLIATLSCLRKILKTLYTSYFGEEYVGYNRRPSTLLGYTTVDVKVERKP